MFIVHSEKADIARLINDIPVDNGSATQYRTLGCVVEVSDHLQITQNPATATLLSQASSVIDLAITSVRNEYCFWITAKPRLALSHFVAASQSHRLCYLWLCCILSGYATPSALIPSITFCSDVDNKSQLPQTNRATLSSIVN